jgi:hypothetical protein
MKIRPNDIVLHKPSGEEWVVCGINYDNGQLIPCGYPFPSVARIDDCVLVESCNKPQTEEMKKALRKHGMSNFIEELTKEVARCVIMTGSNVEKMKCCVGYVDK